MAELGPLTAKAETPDQKGYEDGGACPKVDSVPDVTRSRGSRNANAIGTREPASDISRRIEESRMLNRKYALSSRAPRTHADLTGRAQALCAYLNWLNIGLN